jgi:hypothetical protein
MTEIAVEIVGWGGAALILGAYLLISLGKVTGGSPLYQWMNVVGAAGFTTNAWWHGALPVVALNLVWMLIGGFGLWRIWASRRSSTSAM